MRLFCAMVVCAPMALAGAAGADVLLVPNTGTGFDNVYAFDPFDGSLISNNYIPNDGRMSQVIKVVDSGNSTLLMVDEVNNKVMEYGYNGAWIRDVATAANGLSGPFSIAVHNNQIYVANLTGATSPNTIQRFDMDGSNQTTWASFGGAAGIGVPRDILFRAGGDVLIGDSDGDDIERFSLGGAHLGTWHNSDGVSGIDFPQQMIEEANGNVIAAGFTAPFGLYTFNSAGAQIGFVAGPPLPASPRGVFRLGNGKLLVTMGTRVEVYDPIANVSSTVVNTPNASFRFITQSAIPAPGALAIAGLIGLASLGRRRRA